MNVQAYLDQRRRREQEAWRPRALCFRCRQPEAGCFCASIEPFDPGITFAILIHPHEARRRIATGRMSHLTLRGSLLIEGESFEGKARVERLLDDPSLHCVVLYPGRRSMNLSHLSVEARAAVVPVGKRPLVFVIDGTWRTARRMIRLSPRLQSLPQVCFSPPRLSRFRVRKQPAPECFSTIEAIHHLIELLAPPEGSCVAGRKHDRLLDVFDWMVQRQLTFTPDKR